MKEEEMTEEESVLGRKLLLPHGAVIEGRICKAAMTEGLGDEWNQVTDDLCRLYRSWSANHAAGHLLITGNVQVDRRYLERPGNVAIDITNTTVEDEEQVAKWSKYAAAAQLDRTLCIVQLSHPGRQANALVHLNALAPSAIRVNATGLPMPQPSELTPLQIEDVIVRFINATKVVEKAGFAGIQLHSAHGYLLSSFLNPLANVRNDCYGGSLANRASLLLRLVKECRQAVINSSPHFIIAVKLNSSDFQKGGFLTSEAVQVAQWLEETAAIDFIEISGGNYENPSMMLGTDGFKQLQTLGKTSTEIREGYFLEFAKEIKKSLKSLPLMVTGGFRSRLAMENALKNNNADIIGIARPVCGEVDAVSKLLRHEIDSLPRYERDLKLPWYLGWLHYIVIGNLLKVGGQQLWTYDQLIRIGRGQPTQVGDDANILKSMMTMNSYENEKARSLKGLDGIVGIVLNRDSRQQWHNKSNLKLIAFGAIVVLALAYFYQHH